MLTQKQIEARKQGIGGSDAAVIAGISQYKTPLELYYEKRGEIDPPDLSNNQAVHFGNVLEDVIAQEYVRRTGKKVRRINKMLRHKDHDWMIANLDRMVDGENRVLEIKTASQSSEWGESGTDEVPMPYLLQCQHYMAVKGVEMSDLAVFMLDRSRDFRIYHIPRDQELIMMLIDQEKEFWERVQSARPPELDCKHRSASDLIKRLYPGTNGETIELSPESQEMHNELLTVKADIKVAKSRERELKNLLLSEIREGAIGLLPDGSCYTRKEVQRKGFTVEPTSYIDFRHKKGNKNGK